MEEERFGFECMSINSSAIYVKYSESVIVALTRYPVLHFVHENNTKDCWLSRRLRFLEKCLSNDNDMLSDLYVFLNYTIL